MGEAGGRRTRVGKGRAGDAYRIIASRSSHVHRNTEGSTQKPNAASACAHPCGTVVVSLSLSLSFSPSLFTLLILSTGAHRVVGSESDYACSQMTSLAIEKFPRRAPVRVRLFSLSIERDL